RLRCSRVGWGGVHSVTFGGGMAARSLPRLLAADDSLLTGWSLYLERRLFDGTDDAEQCAALRSRRQAIAAARVDLELHCGLIDSTAAVDRLRETGTDEADVVQGVAKIVQAPGDALAAVIGWQLIEAAAVAGGQNGPNALQGLLTQGPIPLQLAMRHGIGEAVWGAALNCTGFAAPENAATPR
ncbi:MAG: DUF885 family protein, partial [Thiohalocapsa sp.]